MNTSDLDDLAPVIGYRATRIVAAWFAGRRLHVPVRPTLGHPLSRLLGVSAFEALVREFAADRLTIPTIEQDEIHQRNRVIAEQLAAGQSAAEVAETTGLTVRRVEQIRVDLVETGILEFAQGFGSAMARTRGRRSSGSGEEKPGSGEVFGDLPPVPSLVSCFRLAAGA